MKKYVTPFATMLLALGFTAQNADAQRFYQRVEDDLFASEIIPGTDYLLQNPWTTDYHYLNGTGTLNHAEEHTVYNFEVVGEDEDGNLTYRLKQKVTGEYLENPDLSGGKVSMTADAGRAYVFTALKGEPVPSRIDSNGDNQLNDQDAMNPDWTKGDVRKIYDPMDSQFQDVFVFCNVNYATSQYDVFEIFHDGHGAMWNQYTNARVFQLYEAQKGTGYDDIYSIFMYGYYPEDETAAKDLFSAGSAPGQVEEAKVTAFVEAWQNAKGLSEDGGASDDAAYHNAIDALAAAKKACTDNVNPVTEGYYVIDNNPAAGRPAYAGTSNACLYEKDGAMYWTGFNKPEIMTVDGASFIWEVKKAEDGGWYLRNYGTDRYAGSQKNNFQVVPSSAAAQQIYDINFRGGQYFSLDQRGQNETYPSLHADQNPGLKIVIWEPWAAASQWRFLPVSADELKGIEGQLEQNRINKEALAVVDKAKADYAKGFVYSSDDCTRDNVFNVGDGLVTEAAGVDEEGGQLISNAPETPQNEPGNCYNNLIDGDFKSYFHTSWSNSAYAKNFHTLDIRLNEAVKTFVIKYAERHNTSDGSPTKIHVYASNDTTNGQWTDQGYMNCPYTWSADIDGTEKKNFIGVAGHDMDQAYTYVRLQVEGTKSNRKSNGNLFFYWSEFRMYQGHFDSGLSLITAVPDDIKTAFETQLKAIEAQLADKKVTVETLEAFKKAYQDFLDNYPDPQIVKNLLAEAKAQAEKAETGEGLGYFAPGAKEALEAALAAVEGDVKDIMTVVEVNAAKEKIEAALAEFNSKLNVPADGQYFYIKSVTSDESEGSAYEKYLLATNNDESQVKYGAPEDMSVALNCIWKTVKHDDGSYSFMNCATGTYLGNPKKNDVKVLMSFDADSLSLRSAKVGGVFNFDCGNTFLNAQPGTGNLVTWGSASGLDNSAFEFEEAALIEEGGTILREVAKPGLQIISVPFSFSGAGSDIYKVAGMKDGKLQLALYAGDEEVPAGTPFFANVDAPEEGYAPVIELYANCGTEELDYNLKGETQNGLKAAIQSVKNIAGAGILFNGNVIKATETDAVAANTGYFVEMPTAAEVDGDMAIEFPENIETGISDVILVPAKGAKAGVYTITGVKLSNGNKVNNLPKGLYIIGGEKVLVK